MLEHQGSKVGIHQVLAQKIGDKIDGNPYNLNKPRPAGLTNQDFRDALEETYEHFDLQEFWEVCEYWIDKKD